VISTFYKLAWDFYKDWGLLTFKGKHKLLRPNMIYNPVWYYLAVVTNTILRFAWVLSLILRSVVKMDGVTAGWLPWGIVFLELIRRFIWNLFRLENEHLHNVEGYRIVHDVPLPFYVTNKGLYEQQSTPKKELSTKEKILSFFFCFDYLLSKRKKLKRNNDQLVEVLYKTNDQEPTILESPMQLPFKISAHWREQMKKIEKRRKKNFPLGFFSSKVEDNFLESVKQEERRRFDESDRVLCVAGG